MRGELSYEKGSEEKPCQHKEDVNPRESERKSGRIGVKENNSEGCKTANAVEGGAISKEEKKERAAIRDPPCVS